MASQLPTNRIFTDLSDRRVLMYASSVHIARPLVEWSTILSSIWYINPSSSHFSQRFSAMALVANYSTSSSVSSTLYSLVSRSGLSLEMMIGFSLMLRLNRLTVPIKYLPSRGILICTETYSSFSSSVKESGSGRQSGIESSSFSVSPGNRSGSNSRKVGAA